MKIKSIEITNVKGIGNHSFDLDLVPNKPNILVAPNGFGKSSFAIAFESLKRDKIELENNNYHLKKDTNLPIVKMIIEEGGTTSTLLADSSQNTISNQFDIFVINSQVTAKATLLKFGGKSIAKPSLEIEPTVLISSIPEKVEFGYNYTNVKKAFGTVGKILPNISELLSNPPFLFHANENISLQKFSQVKIAKALLDLLTEIKAQSGTAEQIKAWIQANKTVELQAVEELNKLALLVQQFDNKNIKDVIDSFLAAFQIIDIYNSLGLNFKKASKYIHYLASKYEYTQVLQSFNTTRINIKPVEDKKKGLLVEWPKAHEISNGQRDVLSFITLFLKARRNFKKRDCILIIDEIFDYLDDANLISFQYFITNLIEDMKRAGKNFFPILMTHLDPMYFNHLCFSKHKLKVVYLKNVASHPNPHILKLIKKREDPTIQALADKHHFHFYPTDIDISAQFTALGLPTSWGESNKFHLIIDAEVKKYLNDQTDFCPLAICFGVRVRIESLIHYQIADPVKKQVFLDTHGTKKKLEYYEDIGIDIPETFYLLGIIYNDRLHWREGLDIIRPIANKLENLTIKKLIRDIFS